jgi:hypothetical protein
MKDYKKKETNPTIFVWIEIVLGVHMLDFNWELNY